MVLTLSCAYGFYLDCSWFVAKGSLGTSCLPKERKLERNIGEEDERTIFKAELLGW